LLRAATIGVKSFAQICLKFVDRKLWVENMVRFCPAKHYLLAIAILLFAAAGKSHPQGPRGIVTPADMNPAIAPGDDFSGYANGGWIKRVVIPPDRAG
jgi:hypothetical protein